jgi:hypothetical protein
MRSLTFHLFAALAVVAFSARGASAQNLLANPGFEDPVTSDGAPFVGSWEAFNGGAGASSVNSSVMPRSGAMHLDLSIINSNNNFAGAFQDVPGLAPGTNVVFSGWHKTTTNPLDLGTEIRIEWRNATAEVSRTPNLVLVPVLGQYTQFNLPSVVPAGADTARVVYAVQTFGAEPTNTGTVFVDDTSFVKIPEPSTVALAGLGGFGLTARRRRRA